MEICLLLLMMLLLLLLVMMMMMILVMMIHFITLKYLRNIELTYSETVVTKLPQPYPLPVYDVNITIDAMTVAS